LSYSPRVKGMKHLLSFDSFGSGKARNQNYQTEKCDNSYAMADKLKLKISTQHCSLTSLLSLRIVLPLNSYITQHAQRVSFQCASGFGATLRVVILRVGSEGDRQVAGHRFCRGRAGWAMRSSITGFGQLGFQGRRRYWRFFSSPIARDYLVRLAGS